MVTIAVYNRGCVDLGNSFCVVLKQGMDMTMDKIAWTVFVDEPAKNPEASMAGVLCVIDKSWWGMGHDQVNVLLPPQGKTHVAYEPCHLFLSILIDISIIPSGTGKTGNCDITYRHNFSVYMYAPSRWGFPIAEVMISKDVKERCIVSVSQGGKIFRGKITAGKNQFYAVNSRATIDQLKQFLDNDIRYSEDFHNIV
jgi:hypothetical protein